MMYDPSHPGESILDLCFKSSARRPIIWASAAHLSAIINGRSAISAEIAIRLAKAFAAAPRLGCA
ncbi:MAG: hypothetical protein H0V34_09890 [Gammaproteobacteria bacterium]|nr:hypothetical protein [Gammaproteobacteria bacterium]MBA3731622.1 hypothetical protein [Gammaproteobacteria bacterium]